MAAASMLAACATPPAEVEDDLPAVSVGSSRELREFAMQRTWIGRTEDDLLRAYGKPAFMLEVPGARLPESYIIVFKGRDRIGHCIDAFVVLKDGPATIWNYFCR